MTNITRYKHHYEDIVYQKVTDHYGITDLEYGRMLVNTNDPAMGVILQESIGEIKELQQFATGIVIDVGANVGSHSICFSKTADTVYAFEPHPITFENLCANLLINMSSNVIPMNYALVSYNGDTMFYDFDITTKHYSMGAYAGNGTLRLPMRTIDSFAFSPVMFIKMDIEGGEFEALKGANYTLQRESPIVYVEIHKPELIPLIDEFMETRGYITLEFISYYTTDEKTKEDVALTCGKIYYKEGRVVWAS